MTLTSDDYTREIRRLHGIIAERDELIIQLQSSIAGAEFKFPAWVPHLTPMESDLLRLLLNRDKVTKRIMVSVLHSGEEPDGSLYPIYILRLRKKLEPLSLVIANEWGGTYYLTAESKARLKQETITWPLPSNPAPSRRKSPNANSTASDSTASPIPSPSA